MSLATRWLAKKHYGKIRYRAKKLGATHIDLSHLRHRVKFEYTTVTFIFRPFECHANVSANDVYKGAFCDESGASKIKKDIDTALEFMAFLREFNDNIEKEQEEREKNKDENNTKES